MRPQFFEDCIVFLFAMNRCRLLIITLAFLIPGINFAQDHLYLEKPSAFRRMEIKRGDMVKVRFEGDKFRYPIEVRGAKGDWIYVGSDSIRMDKIETIWVQRDRFWPALIRGNLIAVAVFYPAMMIINLPHYDFEWNVHGLRIGLVVLGALALRPLVKTMYWKRVRLGKGKWFLETRTPVERL